MVQAKVAQELGYERVYVTDAPALYSDIWSALTLLARETDSIGLGTGVLVPFTRHPVVNAAAIATIESPSTTNPAIMICGSLASSAARPS